MRVTVTMGLPLLRTLLALLPGGCAAAAPRAATGTRRALADVLEVLPTELSEFDVRVSSAAVMDKGEGDDLFTLKALFPLRLSGSVPLLRGWEVARLTTDCADATDDGPRLTAVDGC
jgi:hypothetical protein